MSLTDDRAKTRNMRRDPRVSLLVQAQDAYSYVVVEGTAELMAPAADPHDATVDALVVYYRALRGDHPDWDEYRAAMVADKRLILTIRPTRAYGMDLRTGSVVQFIASLIVTAPLAFLLEGFRVEWAPNFIIAMAWLCVVLSIVTISAMFVLIRRGKAAEVASLFFLVPPTTAIIAWFMFGERVEAISMVGMVLVAAAVAMVTWKPRGR